MSNKKTDSKTDHDAELRMSALKNLQLIRLAIANQKGECQRILNTDINDTERMVCSSLLKSMEINQMITEFMGTLLEFGSNSFTLSSQLSDHMSKMVGLFQDQFKNLHSHVDLLDRKVSKPTAKKEKSKLTVESKQIVEKRTKRALK